MLFQKLMLLQKLNKIIISHGWVWAHLELPPRRWKEWVSESTILIWTLPTLSTQFLSR